jgi:hypothetical protein
MHSLMAVLFLTARFYSVVDVPSSDRVAATQVATSILRAAGIETVWNDCNNRVLATRQDTKREVCLTPLNPDEVVVRLLSTPGPDSVRTRRGTDRLGDAHVDIALAGGSLATVYVDRVARMAHAAGIDVGTLLGRVMAHEIGHLLLGTPTHGASGLMRAEWSTTLLRSGFRADWRFSELDAAGAREGIVRRARAVRLGNDGSTALALPCVESATQPSPAICPSCPVCAALTSRQDGP